MALPGDKKGKASVMDRICAILKQCRTQGGQKRPPRSDHKAYLAPRIKLIIDLITAKVSY